MARRNSMTTRPGFLGLANPLQEAFLRVGIVSDIICADHGMIVLHGKCIKSLILHHDEQKHAETRLKYTSCNQNSLRYDGL